MGSEILYALAVDGTRLPVIDVTHPSFAVNTSDAELAALSERFANEQAQHQEIPAPVQEALRQSVLGRALMTAAAGTYLSGIATYRIKLGPDNLGGQASAIDKSIAASFPALMVRFRLQDMARLLADGLAQSAASTPRRPICLVNVGGGPAADSWNTLILLRGRHPDLLVNRKVEVAVLDLDEQGPEFGARAIEALRAPGAPLCGVEIGVRHFHYDWSDTWDLEEALVELKAREVVCAISSEGGLFEYGSDAEIISNLEALHAGTGADAIVVGSVTLKGGLTRNRPDTNRVPTRPRTVAAFRSLAEAAGWGIETIIERPFSFHVRLVKV